MVGTGGVGDEEGWWNPILCGLPPVEFGDSKGCLPLASDRPNPGHIAPKRWFSTLDLASGYWQVSLSPEARCKTALATHSGLFQFRVMPFGLCNAPATFERLMDQVIQGLRWSRCLVYLDDIISFWTTFEDALDNLIFILSAFKPMDYS